MLTERDPPRRPSSSRRYCRRGGREGVGPGEGSNGPVGPTTVDRRPLVPVASDPAALGGPGRTTGRLDRRPVAARTEGTDMDASQLEHPDGTVVVGVDPSAGAREAAGWAADLAAAWGAPLLLVHVVPQGPTVSGCRRGWASCWTPRSGRVRVAARGDPPGCLVDALETVAATAPECWCSGATGKGPGRGCWPVPSRQRSSTVSPARSRSSGAAPRRCRRPAAVRSSWGWTVPPRDAPRSSSRPVSPRPSVRRLVAVHTWADVVVGIDGGARRPEAPAFLEAEGAALLKAELDGVGRRTRLPVERDLVADTPVRALMDRARSARLLVVGHRGHDSGVGHAGRLHQPCARGVRAVPGRGDQATIGTHPAGADRDCGPVLTDPELTVTGRHRVTS